MKSSREQFEEWLNSTGQKPNYATKRGYWEIWQASRAAIAQEEVTTAPFLKVD